ncbi:MAG: S8 family serine peptidase [Mongoliitalea sp.]
MSKLIQIILFLALWTGLNFGQASYGQEANQPENEILVFILPDSLELDPLAKTRVDIGKAVIKAQSLLNALREINPAGISKAFPEWEDERKIVFNDYGEQVRMPDFHRVFILYFNKGQEIDKALERLQKEPSVVFSERHTQNAVLDNDPQYLNGTQWHLNNTGVGGGTAGADVNAEGAWAVFTGSPSMKISIFDTGVEISHTEFQNKATGDLDVFGSGHGTGVAGVAAAIANNGNLGRGLDWNAQILSKRIFNLTTYQGDAVVSQKVTEAISSGSQILNHSWSGETQSNTLAMSFAYAYKMNRVSVATTGNTWIQETRYPGAYPNVMAVGNTTNTDMRNGSSTFGDHIDVVAPGTNIFTTGLSNGSQTNTGTSFAAPLVSATASLLKGFRPHYTNDDIMQIIRLTADKVLDMGGQEFTIQHGHGRLNSGTALEMARDNELQHLTTSGGTVHSVTGNYSIILLNAHPNLSSGTYLTKRHEVRKQVPVPTTFCNIVGIWGRGIGSNGWNMRNPNFGEGFTEVVPGSLTSTHVTLRTYVYELWTTSGQSLGYYPASPSNAVMAYSVFGLNTHIEGGDYLCSAGTYSLSGIPPNGVSATWVATPSNLFTSNSGSGAGTTANLTPATGASGYATLTFNLTGTCGTTQVNKSFWVGRPNTPGSIIGNTNPSTGSLATYMVSSMPSGATSMSWVLPYCFGCLQPWSFWSGQNLTQMVAQVGDPSGYVQAMGNNPCGNGGASLLYVTPGGGGCSSCPIQVVYPNPASDELTLSFVDPEEGKIIQKEVEPYEVILYDIHGSRLYDGKSSDPVFRMDVSRLKNGFYYLHILNRNGLTKKQIRVER